MINWWGGGRNHYFVSFCSMRVLQLSVGESSLSGTEFNIRSAKSASLCHWIFRKLVRLNHEALGKYIPRRPSWATSWLLATRARFIHPVEKFIPMLPVLLMEIMMLTESNVRFFLFLVLIKRMRSYDDSKIFLCDTSGGKLLLRPSPNRTV